MGLPSFCRVMWHLGPLPAEFEEWTPEIALGQLPHVKQLASKLPDENMSPKVLLEPFSQCSTEVLTPLIVALESSWELRGKVTLGISVQRRLRVARMLFDNPALKPNLDAALDFGRGWDNFDKYSVASAMISRTNSGRFSIRSRYGISFRSRRRNIRAPGLSRVSFVTSCRTLERNHQIWIA